MLLYHRPFPKHTPFPPQEACHQRQAKAAKMNTEQHDLLFSCRKEIYDPKEGIITNVNCHDLLLAKTPAWSFAAHPLPYYLPCWIFHITKAYLEDPSEEYGMFP